ncbi:DNA repair protein RadC [Lacibacterium aquatile]|uniref:DNA repair protein RadC n=1 Tax=Lacibacterium aquatile TaxID=1168082 RepID=A0ABW5DTU7_9PROT
MPPETPTPEAEASPHYHGHRARLRGRFLAGGGEALPDYELLELILFGAVPRGDMKPLAKKLLAKFGSFAAVVTADAAQIMDVDGAGEAVAVALKSVDAAARRLARQQVESRPILGSWAALVDYCRVVMAHESIEQFRLLFLDRRNHLIADEMHQRGTVDHTAVYPREIVKRALELGAISVILVHNHPSGDPAPSKADITLTREIQKATSAVGITVHDHLVIGLHGEVSFKALGLM